MGQRTHRLRLRRVPPVPAVVVVKVEPTYFVRAVVRTVASPDAAVVDHIVEALFAVYRRSNRTNLFTRCVLALNTGHGLTEGDRVVLISVEVAVKAHPVHLSSFEDLVLAHNGNDVLNVTGYDAGVAANAAASIDNPPDRNAPSPLIRTTLLS